MRAALIAVVLAAAGPASAGVPLALAERQIVTLEFDRAVTRIAITDPDLVSVKASGARLSVTGLRAGRAALEIVFGDGATVAYDVAVEGARRPAAKPPGPKAIDLAVAGERRLRVPGVARVLVEENGVARVSVQGETVTVVALEQGEASLVVVDGSGAKTAWQIRVR